MTVPAFSMFSEIDYSGVTTAHMVRDLMEGKTYHELDEWHVLPDSGHIDLIIGENAPTEFYPKVGAWLEKIK